MPVPAWGRQQAGLARIEIGFDAVVSNYVYHNITGADKRALLRETLRVLKKGGVFALNDEMKPHMYGDMEAFAQELRDIGYIWSILSRISSMSAW